MATPTYIALATKTLTSTQTDIVFGSIPQGYRDLVLVANGVSAGGVVDQAIRFNGGSNSTIPVTLMWGNGSTTGATTSNALLDYYGSINGTNDAVTIVHIMDYSKNDRYKIYLSRSTRTGSGTDEIIGQWSDQAPITSITYLANGASLAAGTTVSLFGIEA